MQGLALARRIVMVAVACLAVSGVGFVQAREELAVTLLERTAGIFELARDWQGAPPRAVFVNGARLIVATGSSELPLESLLDRFQARCRRESGGFHEAARAAFKLPEGGLPSLVDGVLRVQEEKQGLVACLALGERRLTSEEWLARVDRFVDSTDLAALGGLRVVRLESVGEQTFFVAIWNDGPLALAQMFPEQGDAPGVDFAGVPRPRGARRLLSAWQEGAPAGVNLYASPMKPAEAYAAFTGDLEGRGFRAADGATLVSGAPLHATLFLKGQQGVVVHGQPDDAGSLLSVLPVENRHDNQVAFSRP